MIKLKNVSKFYSNKGIITSGFSKINVEFNLGEFVSITGESGSGKSTLLNVLSGLDSYEEGEMYINGEETSHYTEEDYEEYRKKYISNIFQNFNLVNSYTVYQNVELILLISGYTKKEIKPKAIDLIKQVDLYKYRNTKTSKLSGGQKQRVAIARALAQNTPIIIADEPTGNLDKKSAESVFKTLKKVSKDKLVIVVTHNYEYVEKYTTRKITMSDGKIIEDKVISQASEITNPNLNKYGKIPFINKLRLGVRNALNLPIKLVLLLSIFLFMFSAIILEEASFNKGKYDEQNYGYNIFMQNIDKDRIIVTKKDKTAFTSEELNNLSKLDNIKRVVKNDYELENELEIYNGNKYMYGSVNNIKDFNIKLDYGRLPKQENEIVLSISKNNYFIKDIDSILDKEFSYFDSQIGSYEESEQPKLKVVGINFNEDLDYASSFYATEEFSKKLAQKYNISKTSTIVKASNQTISSIVAPLESVPIGKCYITQNISSTAFSDNYYNKIVNIETENLYYNKTLDVKVSKVLTKSNYKNITGLTYSEYNNNIFLNPADYQSIYPDDVYQTSIFMEDNKKVDTTLEDLNNMNYKGYAHIKMIQNYDSNFVYFLNIINVIITIILLVVLFFISYVIIKIILKSRQTYFSIFRILGASKKVSKQVLRIELLTILNISFIIIMTLIILINKEIIIFPDLKELFEFMTAKDYAIIYGLVFLMTILISNRFARYIFKNSTITTLNEEAI